MSDAAALPALWLLPWALHLAWGVLLAALGAACFARLARHWRLAGALLLFATVWLPGLASPAFWLGLAFQMPSLASVLWCCSYLYGAARPGAGRMAVAGTQDARAGGWVLAVLAALLGWVLLQDTFALLPVGVYAWGFTPQALALCTLVALLPWVLALRYGAVRWWWVAPAALLLFAALRLPSGNVWDALLDPFLWVGAQLYLLRAALRANFRPAPAATRA